MVEVVGDEFFGDVFHMDPAVLNLIIGCTASGKAALGRELARRTGGEIISIDSMKVYRRMDIGTAKPSAQIRREIPHHLIDVVEPSDDFTVARYVELAGRAIEDIRSRERPIFVVGGTPLYIKALSEGLFEGPGADVDLRVQLQAVAAKEGSAALHRKLATVDPKAASRIHQNDLRRLVRALEVYELTGRPISELQAQWDCDRKKYVCRFIGIRREKADANHRINDRVRKMVAEGFLEEVGSLLQEPAPISRGARQALGYAEMIAHLQGKYDLAEAIELIKINTRQFAKAQRTWLKRFRETRWIDVGPDDTAAGIADWLLRDLASSWPASPR